MNTTTTWSAYRAYVDESGNDSSSKHLVFAAVVAPTEQWKHFARDWRKVLLGNTPKPLGKGKRGKIYFKASDADGLRLCFKNFNREEADEKTDLLAGVLTEHLASGYALSCSIPHLGFSNIVRQRAIVDPKGKQLRHFKDPYYLCFLKIITRIAVLQRKSFVPTPDQMVDFFFDENGKIGKRCIRAYDGAKARIAKDAHPLINILGNAYTADDTEELPIQASDLWASVVRKYLASDMGKKPRESINKLIGTRQVFHVPISAADLDNYLMEWNIESSTRILDRHRRIREQDGG